MKIIVLTSAAMVLLSSSSSSVASAALTKKQQLLLKQRNSHQALFLKDLPNAGGEWQTLENGVEVQPASNLSPLAQEHLRRLTWGKSSGSSSMENDANGMTTIYKDGTETYYDEYSQAWRALGFYIDCDADVQEDGRRQLEDDNNDGITCQRYMLWAAVSKSILPVPPVRVPVPVPVLKEVQPMMDDDVFSPSVYILLLFLLHCTD